MCGIAIINVILGCLAFIFQIMALFVSDDFHTYSQDLAFTGIWGGVYLILFGALLKNHKIGSGTIKVMAVGGVIIGAILIGLFSWSINSYPLPVDGCQGWDYYNPATILLSCSRVVVDSLLIGCGILIVLVNTIIASKASSLVFTSY
ncbi:uncharacterized protein LOC124326618 [Daphnia pulicaria]|uniref:uncharacterized protein LOC124326618 n=1 Tax=Daphnia pulicaria TaxID=35523 RepID=UPI001EEB7E86|nr:uncharacterized protein LOC124326618 [Daphnia pulicaria]